MNVIKDQQKINGMLTTLPDFTERTFTNRCFLIFIHPLNLLLKLAFQKADMGSLFTSR